MNDNTRFFSFKMGSFNESKTCIKSNIGLDVFTIFPKDGDYYIRFNRENEGVFTFKFNGKIFNGRFNKTRTLFIG